MPNLITILLWLLGGCNPAPAIVTPYDEQEALLNAWLLESWQGYVVAGLLVGLVIGFVAGTARRKGEWRR